MKLIYKGPFEKVDVHDIDGDFHRVDVKRGEAFDAPAAVAERLLEQPDNYERVKPAQATAATTEGE